MRHKPGRNPWDPLAGARVGAFAGGLLGALIALVVGSSHLWFILGLGVLGAVIGAVTAART